METDDSQLANRPARMVELKLSPTEENVEVVLARWDTPKCRGRRDRQAGFSGHRATGDLRRTSRRELGQAICREFVRPRRKATSPCVLGKQGEDNLNTVDSLEIGYVDVAAQSPQADVRRELWKPLLLLALFVLVLEWYIYNRRVYI